LATAAANCSKIGSSIGGINKAHAKYTRAQNLIMANYYSSTIQRCGQWNKWDLIKNGI